MLAAAAAVAVEEAVAIVVVDDVWLILLNMLAPFRAGTGRGTTEGRDGERERDAMALCKEPDAVDSDSDDGIVSTMSWSKRRDGREKVEPAPMCYNNGAETCEMGRRRAVHERR